MQLKNKLFAVLNFNYPYNSQIKNENHLKKICKNSSTASKSVLSLYNNLVISSTESIILLKFYNYEYKDNYN